MNGNDKMVCWNPLLAIVCLAGMFLAAAVVVAAGKPGKAEYLKEFTAFYMVNGGKYVNLLSGVVRK